MQIIIKVLPIVLFTLSALCMDNSKTLSYAEYFYEYGPIQNPDQAAFNNKNWDQSINAILDGDAHKMTRHASWLTNQEKKELIRIINMCRTAQEGLPLRAIISHLIIQDMKLSINLDSIEDTHDAPSSPAIANRPPTPRQRTSTDSLDRITTKEGDQSNTNRSPRTPASSRRSVRTKPIIIKDSPRKSTSSDSDVIARCSTSNDSSITQKKSIQAD